MKDFTRPDENMALAVDEGIEMDASSGCVRAWQYLHLHAVPQEVATRVLSQNGPRRASKSIGQETLLQRHPTVREDVAERPTGQAAAEPGAILNFRVSRTNKLSETIDQAIALMGIHNRFYAEAFLRIHAVKTPVIMRVLFDAARRRSVAAPVEAPIPAQGIRLVM